MEIKNLIDSFKPIENRDTETRAARRKAGAVDGAGKGDKVSLSPEAQTFRGIMAAAQSSSDVRSEKVDQIREQIATNTYQMNSRRTAAKMVEQEQALWGRTV